MHFRGSNCSNRNSFSNINPYAYFDNNSDGYSNFNARIPSRTNYCFPER